jgi:DMSO/TMAO reductase YedYZ molybdopterin-dependent catalytic subunit
VTALMPGSDDAVPAVDPEEACQRAIDAGLVLRRADPLNAEISISALAGGMVMSNAPFYVRNHFQIPALDPATWRLEVGGLVERPLSVSLRDLENLPSDTLVVTLECAGNGRSLLEPQVEGERWDLGAVSTAEWTGVPLVDVLDRARPMPNAREVLFRGADQGTVDGHDDPIRFERSLSFDDARTSRALLAYAMNGEPLPVQHGFPLRLVVPRWYAVTSVKWLEQIELVDTRFHGYYQGEKYVYEWPDGDGVRTEPVTWQRVRALVTEPAPGAEVAAGEVTVRGVAWSGAAPIDTVEVSVGDGPWEPARLVGERSALSWQWWELLTRLDRPGSTTLRARATDQAGRTQPERPEWNRLGYGNNVVQVVPIEVRGGIA